MTEHTTKHPGGKPANFLHMEEVYRDKLTAPTFTGVEDVEQFIEEFHDVADVAQWPPQVALVKLREILTERARPFGAWRKYSLHYGAVLAPPLWKPEPVYKCCARRRALRSATTSP